MNKGFDYFSSTDRKSSTQTLLYVFFIAWVIAIVCSFLFGKNIIVYAAIAFIPYIAMKVYSSKHNPFHNIEEGIQKIDPEYYNSLLKQISKTIDIKKLTNQQQRKSIFWGALIKDNKNSIDKQIATYRQNVKRIFNSEMTVLLIWFATIFVLVFVYSTIGQT
jgi:multidrug efflux pump subunit AcrB